ncbi:hypothetical protein GY14_24520 [Delftia tsuruhatensis]|nr:hypothetical protein GY14_24520 [Delftia tsuruhatensis]
MARAADQAGWQLAQQFHLHVIGGAQHVGVADDGIDGFVAQQLQQCAGGTHFGAHLHARMRLRHVDQKGLEQQRRGRGRHANGERAFLAAAQQLQVTPQLGFLQPHAACALGHELAKHCQPGAPRAPVEQLRPEFIFQRADAAAQRRLGEMHGARCVGKGAVLDDGQQVPQLLCIHAESSWFVGKFFI